MTLVIVVVCTLMSLVVDIAIQGRLNSAHDGLGIIASILLVVFVIAMSDYQ